MRDPLESVLVVGGDSKIGRALCAFWQRSGTAVLATSRRPAGAGTLFLDLAANGEAWEPPCRVTVAVLCASVTNIETCQRDPEPTARVNVHGLMSVADRLLARGAFVIYLSTNQVFDGSAPYRRPTEPVSPLTEYGRQKAEVERLLSGRGERAAIVRLTKVVEPGMPLVRGWYQALQNRQAIHPFADMVMAPVPLAFAVEVLHRVATARLPGILQVSGAQDITYVQAAHHLADRAGAGPDLVQPTTSREKGLAFAPPRHTTLDTMRLRTELGLEPPNAWSTLDSALAC
jgi:dTDP-4-dehydrorhamnose reductase